MADTTTSTFGGKLADPQFRRDRATRASRAANSPEGLAKRLAATLGTASDAERAAVLDALGPILAEASR